MATIEHLKSQEAAVIRQIRTATVAVRSLAGTDLQAALAELEREAQAAAARVRQAYARAGEILAGLSAVLEEIEADLGEQVAEEPAEVEEPTTTPKLHINDNEPEQENGVREEVQAAACGPIADVPDAPATPRRRNKRRR